MTEDTLKEVGKTLVGIVGEANVLVVPTDVSKLDQVKALRDKVYEAWGEVRPAPVFSPPLSLPPDSIIIAVTIIAISLVSLTIGSDWLTCRRSLRILHRPAALSVMMHRYRTLSRLISISDHPSWICSHLTIIKDRALLLPFPFM